MKIKQFWRVDYNVVIHFDSIVIFLIMLISYKLGDIIMNASAYASLVKISLQTCTTLLEFTYDSSQGV